MTHSPPIARVRAWLGDSISRPKTSHLLAALILFLCSTQLGHHWWPASALVRGLRVDYLSPTLYFLDLLILFYLVLSPPLAPIVSRLSLLLPLLLANLLFSANPLASLSWSLHLLLYLVFVASLTKPLLRRLPTLLLIAMGVQVILAFLQVWWGHSAEGLWYYLGERFVTVGSPNVALGNILGEVVLRAYGTFSHPNVLAGWLVVCFLIVLTHSRPRKLSLRRLIIPTTLTTCGVFLTESRSAALALFGIILPLFLLSTLRSRLLYFLFLLLGSYLLLSTGPLTRDLLDSLGTRTLLLNNSVDIVHSRPFFGSGANASLSLAPAPTPAPVLLQPDHNSGTLLLSWFGLVGTLALLPSLTSRSALPRTLLPLLPLLFLDHYFLTSPQGLFILLLYLRVN